jgi:hypothetical protein
MSLAKRAAKSSWVWHIRKATQRSKHFWSTQGAGKVVGCENQGGCETGLSELVPGSLAIDLTMIGFVGRPTRCPRLGKQFFSV